MQLSIVVSRDSVQSIVSEDEGREDERVAACIPVPFPEDHHYGGVPPLHTPRVVVRCGGIGWVVSGYESALGHRTDCVPGDMDG